MDVKISVALFCFMLASVLRESDAVKCYECMSMFGTDKKCEDDFNKAGVETIECKLGCGKFKAEKDDLQYVQRMCALTLNEDCIDQKAGGVEGSLCTCKTDYCNSAMAASASLFGAIITLFTLLHISL